MQVVSTVISQSVDDCWAVFTDPSKLTAWVPGLRNAQVVDTDEDGMPREVRFEFAATLQYSLLYSYDRPAGLVHWEPREGDQGAVRGYASFLAVDGGTQFTYALLHEEGRKAAERALDDPRTLCEAFSRWMHERPVE